MSFTSLPNGFPGGVNMRGLTLTNTYGRHWFVDAKVGSDGNTGKRFDRPFQTMSKAFAQLDSGDAIVFRGKIREQLVAPAGVFDVTIIGAGNRPRHADDHTEANGARGSSGATWAAPASPTATTALVRVIHQGWRFHNILFAAHTDYGAVEIVRDAASGDAEKDGSHAEILDCRFAAGKYAVMSGKAGVFTEIAHNVLIRGCEFHDQTDSAIFGINGRRFRILDNIFEAVDGAIELAAAQAIIARNYIGAFTTNGINLTGGTAVNTVTGNYLSGDYSNTGGYVAVSGDSWIGNFADDVAETEVEASGLTNAVPAA